MPWKQLITQSGLLDIVTNILSDSLSFKVNIKEFDSKANTSCSKLPTSVGAVLDTVVVLDAGFVLDIGADSDPPQPDRIEASKPGINSFFIEYQ
ncbi:hypothetical protein [Pseudoalteromonas umbrosa]|uniref:hypothetical protein n=1 Tax=Pseudoalteromonas umbrosa TaxID=3048489 RepID=UPI0024C25A73|nr:hypothetical protein [Pseudoalteromonas sp. B95]MDK1286995.1 hypothetical protein [Pseudoalteromonas sp. B95]